MLASFSRRLSSWPSSQSSKSRHFCYVFIWQEIACLLCNILLKLTFEKCIDTVWLPYWVWFLGIDKFYVRAQAFIQGVFITRATSLALASLFPELVNIAGSLCWTVLFIAGRRYYIVRPPTGSVIEKMMRCIAVSTLTHSHTHTHMWHTPRMHSVQYEDWRNWREWKDMNWSLCLKVDNALHGDRNWTPSPWPLYPSSPISITPVPLNVCPHPYPGTPSSQINTSECWHWA